MFVGVDPDKAFKLMELDFREGNAVDADRQLKMGRHVLVTAEFKQLKGLDWATSFRSRPIAAGWTTRSLAWSGRQAST